MLSPSGLAVASRKYSISKSPTSTPTSGFPIDEAGELDLLIGRVVDGEPDSYLITDDNLEQAWLGTTIERIPLEERRLLLWWGGAEPADLAATVEADKLLPKLQPLEGPPDLEDIGYAEFFLEIPMVDGHGTWKKGMETEAFHFTRSNNGYLPLLDLKFAPFTGDTPLTPKLIWREHVKFYATKSLTTVMAMRMLGNSSRGITALYKRLLYRLCVVPIAMYSYQL
ncbi:hypothetical protein L218DRAFT_1005828 [Marasmius fiardii PR-910]|nr:hypothetical protein L218DRAFT_1005828 [Marasmius fiardii PR-910]